MECDSNGEYSYNGGKIPCVVSETHLPSVPNTVGDYKYVPTGEYKRYFDVQIWNPKVIKTSNFPSWFTEKPENDGNLFWANTYDGLVSRLYDAWQYVPKWVKVIGENGKPIER